MGFGQKSKLEFYTQTFSTNYLEWTKITKEYTIIWLMYTMKYLLKDKMSIFASRYKIYFNDVSEISNY